MGCRSDLDARLAHVNAAIASHPLASRSLRAALAVIEEFSFGGTQLIEQRLAERELPTLDTVAQLHSMHAHSWWRLHHERDELTCDLTQTDLHLASEPKAAHRVSDQSPG